MNAELIINEQNIQNKIYNVRNLQVMLDSDLAELYGVETKVFNQAVKRNIARFPSEFRFQITEEEFILLRSQIVTSSKKSDTKGTQIHGGRRYLPYVFTEQGVSMLSAALRSDTAIQVSINIINSFVQMRRYLVQNAVLFQRVEALEFNQKMTNQKLETVFEALESKETQPSQGIFFEGQIYDAYAFVSDLIKSARKSIILLDNYSDDTVLTLLSKNPNITITIYTKTISKQLALDAQKYNSQYKNLTIKEFDLSHDRFLIIDNEVYHIGASLKDLGKKWFAFSKMDSASVAILEKLND